VYTHRFYAEANGCDNNDNDNCNVNIMDSDGGGRDKDNANDNDGDGKANLKDKDVTTCESLTSCRANTTICTSHRSGHNWVTPTNGDDPPMPSRFFRWLMSPYAKSFDTSAAILDFFSQHCT
jgi:poly(3-hydroxybutyrate) depolymerase